MIASSEAPEDSALLEQILRESAAGGGGAGVHGGATDFGATGSETVHGGGAGEGTNMAGVLSGVGARIADLKLGEKLGTLGQRLGTLAEGTGSDETTPAREEVRGLPAKWKIGGSAGPVAAGRSKEKGSGVEGEAMSAEKRKTDGSTNPVVSGGSNSADTNADHRWRSVCCRSRMV